MSRHLLSALAAASVLGFTSFASAADLPMAYKAPPAPISYGWSGFYLGAHVGAGWGTRESSINGIGLIGGAGSIPFSQTQQNGFLGGAQAGFNWQTGIVVLGVEGEFSATNIEGTSPCFVALACKAENRWIATAAARLGVTVDRALIYVKGGAAWSDARYSVSVAGFGLSDISDTRVGGLIGTGIEYAIGNNWSAKLEYNYIDFGSDDVTATLALAPVPITASVDHKLHTVKAGINYRFGTF